MSTFGPQFKLILTLKIPLLSRVLKHVKLRRSSGECLDIAGICHGLCKVTSIAGFPSTESNKKVVK